MFGKFLKSFCLVVFSLILMVSCGKSKNCKKNCKNEDHKKENSKNEHSKNEHSKSKKVTKKSSTIDEEIKYLEDVKRGYEAKATMYADRAQELQFEEDRLQDAKRYWRLSDLNKKAAEEVEKEIETKKKQRDGFFKRK